MSTDKQKQKWMSKLMSLDGAVQSGKNVHDYVIRSPSPSLNATFGNAHGLPAGCGLILFGPPKGGKSLVCNAMIGQLHRDDPEAVAVKFNTEFRETGQLTPDQMAVWGIDPDRYVAYESNNPVEIFDRIEHELAALVQEGMKLKLVVLDSVSNIQGRRGMGTDTLETQNRGDRALTIQEGLMRILPYQKRLGFALIMTAHIRAEQDPGEVMRGNKVRAALSYGAFHHSEYIMLVEPNRSKDGRQDLLGNDFRSDSVEDLNGKGEKLGHRIRVKMMDSSFGPKERTGEFTLDYRQGVINTHEEVFRLGLGWGVIQKPNNLSYAFGGAKWTGKPAFLEALRGDPKLCADIVAEIRRRDAAGEVGKSSGAAEDSDDLTTSDLEDLKSLGA